MRRWIASAVAEEGAHLLKQDWLGYLVFGASLLRHTPTELKADRTLMLEAVPGGAEGEGPEQHLVSLAHKTSRARQAPTFWAKRRAARRFSAQLKRETLNRSSTRTSSLEVPTSRRGACHRRARSADLADVRGPSCLCRTDLRLRLLEPRSFRAATS